MFQWKMGGEDLGEWGPNFWNSGLNLQGNVIYLTHSILFHWNFTPAFTDYCLTSNNLCLYSGWCLRVVLTRRTDVFEKIVSNDHSKYHQNIINIRNNHKVTQKKHTLCPMPLRPLPTWTTTRQRGTPGASDLETSAVSTTTGLAGVAAKVAHPVMELWREIHHSHVYI